MAADVVALPVVNGIHAPSASDLAEYEKLIKLRDSVFSGQHPKLKLSSSSATQDSTQSAAANAQAITSNSAVNATFNFSNANGAVNQPNLLPPPQPNGQLMPAVPLPGFDPALLEKSPLLIATESNISRKSLEDAIQQEVKRRQTTWPKLDRENILPAFDVDDILRKAQEHVKPVLIDTEKLAMKDRSPARSTDEQSFNSSQAHEDEVEDPRDKLSKLASKPCTYFFKKGNCIKGENCKFSHDPAFAAQLRPEAPLTEVDRSYANAGHGGPPSKKQKRDEARHGQQNGNQGNAGDDAKRRADEQYQRDLARAEQGQYNDQNYDSRYVPTPPSARHLPPQDNRRFSGRGMTPSRDVPVVRSTITSPLAPQPARVSPLAMKGPSYVEKIRVDGPNGPVPHYAGSRPHSPPNPQQLLNRKRRRDTNPNNGPETANVRRRVASPEIRIKDEPVSPKPMDAVPRYVPREEVVRRPVDVDAYSPQGGRIEQRPVREVHYIDDPGYRRVSSPVVRVVSRAEPRQEFRREPELRRVVSERQMVRAESPGMSIREPAYYNDAPRPMPPPREVYVSRPDGDQQAAYRASVAPTGPPPPEYALEPRRARSPVQPSSGSMAPPPVRQRIVRDQYGNEYYERIIAEPPRYSVAPETRYVTEPSYNGRPASRVGSVVPESTRQYHEPPPVQRRMEPEPTSPRYAEYPSQASVRASSVAPNFQTQTEYGAERSQVIRVGEYPRGEERYERVVQEAPRVAYTERPREVYYDDAPRDGAYRVQSVRPEQTRYMDADDRYVRQVSVHPAEGGYERVAHSMAPPPPRYEYADGRGAREYTVAGNGPQYIG